MATRLNARTQRRATLLAATLLATFSALASLRADATMQQVANAAPGPALTVNVGADRHPISPDIYGVTFWWGDKQAAESAFARDVRLPLNRSGGDATTRYNWEADASNAGSDWYYMGGNGRANPTPGASNDTIVAANNAVGAKSIITIPIIQNINASSDWNCSFPRSVYGEQESFNPYVHPNGDDCGNGVRKDGSQIADTNIAAHDKPNDPAIQRAWVEHLVGRFGTAANGGVGIYQLDNEPSGWLAVHRDVHPQGVGYSELRDRSVAYAAAIKAADPSAKILGPGDIPYAYQDCNNCGNDGAAAHGGVPFGQWYLQQMAAYERQHGVRLLDYYSMHYPGCCGSNPIALAHERIATFRGWIGTDYPGTRLGFDEYNWGDANTLTNALLTADGLGLFGRDQVDLASYWGLDDVTWPTAYAFRMYRNYDGKNGAFGETSLHATSAAPQSLAVYAAQRNADGALTVMVVNHGDADQTSSLALSGFGPAATAQVYTYSGSNLTAIMRQPDLAVSASGWSATYAAHSITLVVVSASGPVPTASATAPTVPTTSGGTPTRTPLPTSTPPACTPTAVLPTRTGIAATPAAGAHVLLPLVSRGGQASCR